MSQHTRIAAAQWIGRVVEFTANLETQHLDVEDAQFEPGMIGCILRIDVIEHDLVLHHIETRPFEDRNRPLLTPSYYDANGVARLTAREAGHWEDVARLYMGAPDHWRAMLTPIGQIARERHTHAMSSGRATCVSCFPTNHAFHSYRSTALDADWNRTMRRAAGLAA
mgnify:CR=1 FL=1